MQLHSFASLEKVAGTLLVLLFVLIFLSPDSRTPLRPQTTRNANVSAVRVTPSHVLPRGDDALHQVASNEPEEPSAAAARRDSSTLVVDDTLMRHSALPLGPRQVPGSTRIATAADPRRAKQTFEEAAAELVALADAQLGIAVQPRTVFFRVENEAPAGNSMNQSSTDTPLRVATCFFGVLRENSTTEVDTWAMNRRYLFAHRLRGATTFLTGEKHGVPITQHDIFASTWDRSLLSKWSGGDKVQRDLARSWFPADRSVARNITERLQAIYRESLRGAFIGNHSQLTNCSKIHCVVASVQSGCVRVISDYERRTGVKYDVVMLLRNDYPVAFPFHLRCRPGGRSGGRFESCTATFGHCASFFQGKLWPSGASFGPREIISHIAFSEPARDTRYWKFLSDLGFVGMRDDVGRLIATALDRMRDPALNAPHKLRHSVPEWMMARAAEEAGLTVRVVNTGMTNLAGIISPVTGLNSAPFTDPRYCYGWYKESKFVPKYLVDVCGDLGAQHAKSHDLRLSHHNAPFWPHAAASCCSSVRECDVLQQRAA